ncbi:MAG TPA: hypothetical protein VMS98_07670 [Thermoanaerobaculia bacterium]|nr:hypothetical protein [Thermoanaerobaculia bacterium]
MKRLSTSLVCALVLATGAAAVLYADSSSQLSIEPSAMRDGETKSFTDDGRTITVRRDGNTTHIRIDNADKTEKLTITRDGRGIQIGHLGHGSTVIAPRGRQIVIDGMPLDEMIPKFRSLPPREMSTFYVCPNDKTTLRVPEAKENAKFKCPVDGAEMEKKKGRGFTFFFDDFGSHHL